MYGFVVYTYTELTLVHAIHFVVACVLQQSNVLPSETIKVKLLLLRALVIGK